MGVGGWMDTCHDLGHFVRLLYNYDFECIFKMWHMFTKSNIINLHN